MLIPFSSQRLRTACNLVVMCCEHIYAYRFTSFTAQTDTTEAYLGYLLTDALPAQRYSLVDLGATRQDQSRCYIYDTTRRTHFPHVLL